MSVLFIIGPKRTLAMSHKSRWVRRRTDRRTDAWPLHYAFRYGCGQRKKHNYRVDMRMFCQCHQVTLASWLVAIIHRRIADIIPVITCKTSIVMSAYLSSYLIHDCLPARSSEIVTVCTANGASVVDQLLCFFSRKLTDVQLSFCQNLLAFSVVFLSKQN